MGKPGIYEHPITDRWKSEVLAEKKRRGWSNAELGRRVGVSGPNISNTLKPIAQGGYRHSSAALEISRELGVPPPQLDENEEREHVSAMLFALRSISPAVFEEEVRRITRTLASQRKLLEASTRPTKQSVRKARNISDE